MRELGRSYYPPQPPLIAEPDDIVVQATDILFEYLPHDSGIAPELAVIRVKALLDSPAGAQAYLIDALEPAEMTNAAVVVVRLAQVLDAGAPDAKEMVSRLLEVVESPLAVEVYDREMERRRPRDADRWH
jgi:hypothetical protein